MYFVAKLSGYCVSYFVETDLGNNCRRYQVMQSGSEWVIFRDTVYKRRLANSVSYFANCPAAESQVCLLETRRGQVWAGSHNSVVYVVDNADVVLVTDTLLAHADKVVAMTITASSRY